MAEPGELAAQGAPDEMAATATSTALPPELAALRASGAAARDPVRFAYLLALARRAAMQSPAIRLALEAKIGAAADELAARPAAPAVQPATGNNASPLAELLAHINRHAEQPTPAHRPAMPEAASKEARKKSTASENFGQTPENASVGRHRPAPELKSVAYFRNEWSKLSTEQQLTRTLAQAPENAGPMNSQHLVLRSLQRMRDIAPDYLQGFMSYIDTLIWLEHADPTKSAATRATAGEAEKKTRGAKRGATSR